jgi:hypothetical protein
VSLTYDTSSVNYDRNMFIIQDTDAPLRSRLFRLAGGNLAYLPRVSVGKKTRFDDIDSRLKSIMLQLKKQPIAKRED